MARVQWSEAAHGVFLELPIKTRRAIAEKIRLLRLFPRMYQMRSKGRFRRHRRFVAGDWVVYYRVVENTVYIRGLWPARLP